MSKIDSEARERPATYGIELDNLESKHSDDGALVRLGKKPVLKVDLLTPGFGCSAC